MELKNLGNMYGAAPDRPYHLSVGAVILNSKNDVICLHYKPSFDTFIDTHLLMTKTVRLGESLEQTLVRGAKQELGIDITLITFLGTQVTQDTWWGELKTPTPVEKSVTFFLAKVTQNDQLPAVLGKDFGDGEVTVKQIDTLIREMETLAVKDGMRDFNQAIALHRAKTWIEKHPELVSPTL